MPELSASAQLSNRRKDARKRVVVRGKVVYSNGAFSVDCMIRNISSKGARITVEKGIGIPTHVYLIDIPAGIAYAAEVASIRADAFGLRLLRSHKIADLKDPELRYLKYVWQGCAR
jgi:PilZ domain-containing protein